MLGSVFLGFPQTQDVVSSLTSAVLQVSQRTCCLRVPSSHQHFMAKWQTPEALQAYKNRLSWWNWLASGLGRKENELLYPGYSESSSSGSLFPARCCTPATRLRANLGFACCCCPHPAVARNTFLPAPCCVSSPSVLLFFTCMSPPSENPPRKPRHSRHSRRISLLLYFPFVWLLLFVELLSSPLHSQTQVCDPDLRNGHP